MFFVYIDLRRLKYFTQALARSDRDRTEGPRVGKRPPPRPQLTRDGRSPVYPNIDPLERRRAGEQVELCRDLAPLAVEFGLHGTHPFGLGDEREIDPFEVLTEGTILKATARPA